MPNPDIRLPRRARDIMSQPALAIGPGTSLGQAVALMTEHRISGVPVVDADGRPIGMLTEGDLLRRVETGTLGDRPGWLASVFRPGALAGDYVRTHGRRVEEIMTTGVISVEEDARLSQVVALMRKHRIKRLPVVRGDRLVGVVSRADLVARVGAALAAAMPDRVEDAAIRQSIVAAMEREPWSPGRLVDVAVKHGVVRLGGCVFDARARQALEVMAENTPGVQQVENNLVCIEAQSGLVTFDPAWERPTPAI